MHPFFAINRLSAYLDGDLPRKERLELERVLSRHPELEAELLRVQGAVRLLNQLGPTRAPRRLVPEALQALELRQSSLFRGPGRARNLLLFLGAATVIATGLVLWMRQDAPPAPASVPPSDDFLVDAVTDADADPTDADADPTGADADAAGAAPGDELARPPNAIDIDALPPDPPSPLSQLSVTPAQSAQSDDGSELTPYIPSWDQDPVHHEEGSPTLLQVAVYRIYATRADVLQDMHKLAQANGTLLVDSQGHPVQIRALKGGDDFASVYLTLATDQIQPFLSQLASLGLAVEISPPESDTERQQLLLEVVYKP